MAATPNNPPNKPPPKSPKIPSVSPTKSFVNPSPASSSSSPVVGGCGACGSDGAWAGAGARGGAGCISETDGSAGIACCASVISWGVLVSWTCGSSCCEILL